MEAGGTEDLLLDIEEAARLLGTTVRQLRRLRFENRITYIKIGSKLRFRRGDLLNYIEANTFRPADHPGSGGQR